MATPGACRALMAAMAALTLLTPACGSTAPAPQPPAAAPAPTARAAGTPSRTDSTAAWLMDVTGAMGLAFHHTAGIDGTHFMPEVVGSGGALLDADGDGDLDLYLVDSGPHPPAGPAAAPNRFFRQDEGHVFTDATATSGLGDTGYGMGVAVGDMDNDGDPDVYVTNLGPDALYRNDGDGTFTAITAAAGIGSDLWSTSAAFVDADADGHLDLFVVHYLAYSPGRECHDASGRLDYCGPLSFSGVPDTLYMNNGDGTFRDASEAAGIARRAGRGLGVQPADFNDDGRIDLYVANDGMENYLWINEGGGVFAERAMVSGVAVNMHGKAEASMGITVGDIDQDGDMDLFSTHLDRETNTFYTNLGGGLFEDRTAAAGLAADSLPYTGFGTEFLDLDLDGDLDLVAVNGRVRRAPGTSAGGTASGAATAPGSATFLADYAQPNHLYENLGGGRFTLRQDAAGPLGSAAQVSRGLIPGDINGDGALDLVITNGNGPVQILSGRPPGRSWLMVRAIDAALGRDALGARIEVRAAAMLLVQTVSTTASYLTARDPEVHFGLGGAGSVNAVQVRWPSGESEIFPGGPVNRHMRVVRGQGQSAAAGEQP